MSTELRRRLPASFVIAGLGGLLSTALVTALFDRPERARARTQARDGIEEVGLDVDPRAQLVDRPPAGVASLR